MGIRRSRGLVGVSGWQPLALPYPADPYMVGGQKEGPSRGLGPFQRLLQAALKPQAVYNEEVGVHEGLDLAGRGFPFMDVHAIWHEDLHVKTAARKLLYEGTEDRIGNHDGLPAPGSPACGGPIPVTLP